MELNKQFYIVHKPVRCCMSRRPHPQRTLHKHRKGGDLFLFTHLHLTGEVSVLFIYLLYELNLEKRKTRYRARESRG